MHLMAMGLSHKTASQDQRQQLVFSNELVVATITEIMHSAQVNAAVLLSTCNRTEIYLEASSLSSVLRWLQREHKIKGIDLRANTYLYMDLKAVQHIMRVASGLDSMVLGEVEILGQLKNAYQLALQHGLLSKSLSRLLQTSFAVAKKVRTQTDIGLNPVSVAYLAVRLAERIFASIAEQTVLLIGAGDTARLVAKHLASAGVTRFVFANRTIAKARAMAQEIGLTQQYEIIGLSQIPEYLPRADIVVAATTAPLPIVGKGMVERAIKIRKHKAMFMVDLAVTRDIEVQVREIADVYLYGIDDLQNIAAEHQRYRSNAAQQADLIIVREADRFMQWLDSQHVSSTIHAFREQCKKQRDIALYEALRQLDAGKDPRLVLQRFGHVLLNRVIHEPTVQMRAAATSQDSAAMLTIVRKLFNIGLKQESKEESFIEL
jgi:glutamyl-tRNA reductase